MRKRCLVAVKTNKKIVGFVNPVAERASDRLKSMELLKSVQVFGACEKWDASGALKLQYCRVGIGRYVCWRSFFFNFLFIVCTDLLFSGRPLLGHSFSLHIHVHTQNEINWAARYKRESC